jgi:uroporphyrinogen-III synthase
MRLALPRPADHPLSQMAQSAGWTPVPFPVTRLVEAQAEPPLDLGKTDAIIVLSPSGARVAAPQLPMGMTVLAQGLGTADALGRRDLDLQLASTAKAEALWELLRQRFPGGGSFVLVRGERSREYLEMAARESMWSIHPWITHREAPLLPLPDLPPVDAVLAMSPLQAQILAGMAKDCMRFAWGEVTAQAFERAGRPATAWCDPKPLAFHTMLAKPFQEVVR